MIQRPPLEKHHVAEGSTQQQLEQYAEVEADEYNNELMYVRMHKVSQQLTSIASRSFCPVAASLWNRKPISC